MAIDQQVDIRPRTTGEVLDDAVRLSLADVAPLLALSGLFLVPAFAVILFLLMLPPSGNMWQTIGMPGLAAVLLPLTGLGSGACQELFRRRASDIPVTLRGCLGASLRHGLVHVAARTLLLGVSLIGLLLLFVPGLVVWAALATVHALLSARELRLGAAVRESA